VLGQTQLPLDDVSLGVGHQEGQEVSLAVRLKRAALDTLLQEAIYSTFVPGVYASEDA
jgi:hypothetical protein